MATYWINQEFLIENSVIDSNVEYSKLKPAIITVQNKYVKRVLGTNLYRSIENSINANVESSTAIPARLKELLDDYILLMMVQYIMVEASPAFKYRWANKGIMVKNSDNSESAPIEEIKIVVEDWKHTGEMYANDLKSFILGNKVTYPEYFNNAVGNVKPICDNYDVDMFLG